jgi:peptide/nickel transport system ATP-binding protein
MIAMALALEPALLIADEPTTPLDVTTQAQILKLIIEIQKKHWMAVLFITHDFGVVAEIAHRVAVLREGRLVELGTKMDVLTRPRDEYTRMLIRSVPTLQPHGRAVSPEAPVVLQTRDLSKTYVDRLWIGRRRTVRAASSVSLTVRKGQTLGLVGESGSGKSTVARCIVRLIEPSSGEIRLGSDELAHLRAGELRPLRRRVQIVFQDPYRSLNPRRSVGEAIIEGPLNYGVSRADALERARRLMALVRMDPQALGRYPHQFRAASASSSASRVPWPSNRAADRRRGGLGARRLGAGAGAGAPRGDPPPTHPAMLFITHDLRVAAGVRRSGGDARQPRGGVRADEGEVWCGRSTPYAGARRRGARPRLRFRQPIKLAP